MRSEDEAVGAEGKMCPCEGEERQKKCKKGKKNPSYLRSWLDFYILYFKVARFLDVYFLLQGESEGDNHENQLDCLGRVYIPEVYCR